MEKQNVLLPKTFVDSIQICCGESLTIWKSDYIPTSGICVVPQTGGTNPVRIVKCMKQVVLSWDFWRYDIRIMHSYTRSVHGVIQGFGNLERIRQRQKQQDESVTRVSLSIVRASIKMVELTLMWGRKVNTNMLQDVPELLRKCLAWLL